MRYTRRVLNKEITVSGPNFWGWDSTVILRPAPKGAGWWWQLPNGHVVAINDKTLTSSKRRLVLRHDTHTLNAPDHLLPLAAAVNGVCIVQQPGWRNSWMPYGDGSGSIFWHAVEPGLVTPTEHDTVPVYQRIITVRNARKVVSFTPHPSRLEITVHIDYPGLGKHSETFVFPEDFPEVIKTPTQGWPPKLYRVSQLAGILGWPHKNSVVWPQRQSASETLAMFARHRALDLLGVIAATMPAHMVLSGIYESAYAGHREDIELLRTLAAQKNVVNLFRRAA